MLLKLFSLLRHPFRSAANVVSESRFPIPGLDFKFLAQCDKCDDFTGFTSVRGGEQYQCNSCGDRSKQFGFKDKDIKDLQLSSWAFWQKWKAIPYDWHTMPEEEKVTYLGFK